MRIKIISCQVDALTIRKNNILRSIVIIALSILLSSCLNKTSFSEKDFSWINVYEEQDTLIFREKALMKTDTTIIGKKKLYHANYQPIAHGNLVPHTFKLYYWNKTYASKKNRSFQLIEMYKDSNKKDAYPWINYLGFMYGIEEKSMKTNEVFLELSKKSFNNVLILENKKNQDFKEYMKTRPNILFWDIKHGIIKYQTYNGEIWERINIK